MAAEPGWIRAVARSLRSHHATVAAAFDADLRRYAAAIPVRDTLRVDLSPAAATEPARLDRGLRSGPADRQAKPGRDLGGIRGDQAKRARPDAYVAALLLGR